MFITVHYRSRWARKSSAGCFAKCMAKCSDKTMEEGRVHRTQSMRALAKDRETEPEYVEPVREDDFFDHIHKTAGEMYEVVGQGNVSDGNKSLSLKEKLGQVRTSNQQCWYNVRINSN